MSRIAIYVRADSDPESQLAPLRRSLREGWARLTEYVDAGRETTQRERLLADVRAGQLDVVLFSRLKHLCEDGFTATVDLLEELADNNVAWQALAEENLESCRMLRSLLRLAGRTERKGDKKTCHSKSRS